jgi:hypothetical protein
MKKIYLYLGSLITLFPLSFVHAQQQLPACPTSPGNISDVLNLAGCILRNAVLPLLITLSIVVFIVGIVKYIGGADEASKREEGRRFMLYGIIALFVMVSIWGLVGTIQGTFGIGTSVLIPQLQTN